MANETRLLANYLYNINYRSFDNHTIEIAKMCLEDFIGVAFAGSQKKEFDIWRKYYDDKPSDSCSTIFSSELQLRSVEQAAALNAVAGHVMDLDDVHTPSITHLAVITIPTAIALGEKLHKSGLEVIEAIVAGYECGARIGECINPSSYKFWHTTGVVGAFSSGTVAAHLLGLSESEIVNMLGSAGSEAAGLWEFINSGSMTKVLHVANANLCGIRAAELAKLGFTGSPTILEGDRGFVKAIAPAYKMIRLTDNYGSHYCITENSFKAYACCRHIHSAGYSIEKIKKSHPDFNWKQIESIEDFTYSTAIQTADNPYPENAYAAKFSIQFCIAAAFVLGKLSDQIFTKENIQNSDIQNLMKKIEVKLDPEIDAIYKNNPNEWPHKIILHLKDGSSISETVFYPIGDSNNPFTWDDMDKKFRNAAGEILGKDKTEMLISRIHSFDKEPDISGLFKF